MWHQSKARLRRSWNTTFFPAEPTTAFQLPRHRDGCLVVLLSIVSLGFLMPNLSYPLIEPDETRYAQIALEMNRTGDWITPCLNGQAYLDKPPLMYWLTAISFATWGDNETAARLPAAFAAIATILLTYTLGRRILGWRSAALASMLMLLSGGFVLAGRFLVLDSLLTLWTTLCLLSGYLAVCDDTHRWPWWGISGLACALGVLTKGPVAIVLCVPPLIASGWLRRDHTRPRLSHWCVFFLTVLACCAPWYITVWKSNPQFGDYFFVQHNLERFTRGSNHEQPFWFYLPVLLAALFPASLLLPSLAFFLAKRDQMAISIRSKELGFVFCAAMWVLLFFSLASCKLPTYILPAIPLLCLILGHWLGHVLLASDRSQFINASMHRFPQHSSLILAITCLMIVGGGVWYHGTIDFYGLVAIAACVVSVIFTTACWNRPWFSAPVDWLLPATLAALGVSLLTAQLLPAIATVRSSQVKVANLLLEHPRAAVVYFGRDPHAVRMRVPTDDVVYFPASSEAAFREYIQEHPLAIVVSSQQHIEASCRFVATTHHWSCSDPRKHVFLSRPIESNSVAIVQAKLIQSASSDETRTR